MPVEIRELPTRIFALPPMAAPSEQEYSLQMQKIHERIQQMQKQMLLQVIMSRRSYLNR